MKKLNLILALMLLCIFSNAQTAAEFVKQAEAKFAARDEPKALDLFKNALIKDQNNVKALCGACEMCCKIGNRTIKSDDKKALFNTAKQFATKALQLEPNNAECNYMMALAMGRMALISGSKDKVAASRDIKKYADKAVALNPNYALAWHVIGKYNFEVSHLNFAEKGAANMLFGGLPAGDLKTAIACYEKCKTLDKGYNLNLLELAKCYIENKQTAAAKVVLTEIAALPLRYFDDTNYKAQAAALLLTLK
jgi:tetratricopeptide (TPR) repeat protein